MKNTKIMPGKFLLAVCTMLLFGYIPVLAAGPITHAILADRFLRIHDKKYSAEEKAAFRAGSLFPDIRYLATNISREDTHFPDVTLDDILQEPSPFVAGMKFHSFVDDTREEFVVAGNYYSQLKFDSKIKHTATYLKFLEDEIVYPSLEKGPWLTVANTVFPEELEWGIPDDKMQRWHYLLNLSFSYYPSTLIFMAHLKGKGLLDVPAKEVAVWYATFEKKSKTEPVKTYTSNLFKMFSNVIK